MKTIEQVIGYLEGRKAGLVNYEPPKQELYFIDELLEYINN